jgi:hypothetical protein
MENLEPSLPSFRPGPEIPRSFLFGPQAIGWDVEECSTADSEGGGWMEGDVCVFDGRGFIFQIRVNCVLSLDIEYLFSVSEANLIMWLCL